MVVLARSLGAGILGGERSAAPADGAADLLGGWELLAAAAAGEAGGCSRGRGASW